MSPHPQLSLPVRYETPSFFIFAVVGGLLPGPKGSEEPAVKIPFAHDMAIWDMKWHPAGHLLATGSNDRQTKFWARNRPGARQGLDDDGPDAGDFCHGTIRSVYEVGLEDI